MLFKQNIGKYKVFRTSKIIIIYLTQADFSITHISVLKTTAKTQMGDRMKFN